MTHYSIGFAAAVGLAAALGSGAAHADKIKHPTAVFAGLDKITGRIISFDVATDETVQFGSLQITPRVCYTRPPTEAPQTDGFVEVEEVETDNQFKRIFSGWMYAASPGLHGVEHAVYDVWLTDCKGGSAVIPEVAALPEENILPNAPTQPLPPKPGTVPRPRQAARPPVDPNQPGGAPPSQQPGAPGQQPGFPPQPGQPARPTIAGEPPRPRVNVGANNPPAAPAPRRAPIQSFFPTASNPGDSVRERELNGR
jgi:hypothetical protein